MNAYIEETSEREGWLMADQAEHTRRAITHAEHTRSAGRQIKKRQCHAHGTALG